MANFQNEYDVFSKNIDVISFYKNFKKTKFEGILAKKVIELKNISKKLNNNYENNPEYTKKSKYIRVMNKIKTNPKGYKITNDLEKYLLFMFSVDPEYNAIYMYASVNKIQDMKLEMIKKFGIYDPNLILIEKYYIKYILGPKKRKEIENKIEELSFR